VRQHPINDQQVPSLGAGPFQAFPAVNANADLMAIARQSARYIKARLFIVFDQ
jgi:hypothetical protein